MNICTEPARRRVTTRSSIESYYNEYLKVLEECTRTQTGAKQLLGSSYSNFKRIKPIAELFIVDPENARRLFSTHSKFVDLSKYSAKELVGHREELTYLAANGDVLPRYFSNYRR